MRVKLFDLRKSYNFSVREEREERRRVETYVCGTLLEVGGKILTRQHPQTPNLSDRFPRSEYIEQRGLACSRGAHERGKLTRTDLRFQWVSTDSSKVGTEKEKLT